MWQQIFPTIEKCLDSELFNALNDAQAQGLITADKMAYLWAYKKEGMRWLNEPPDEAEEFYAKKEEIDDNQRFQNRPEHYQQEEMS